MINRLFQACVVCIAAVAALSACAKAPAALVVAELETPASGPLHISTSVPRFFVDGNERPVYLSGSHTWNTVQDWGASQPPPAFDYAEFLSGLRRHGHNFTRFFVWEQVEGVPWAFEQVWFSPQLYLRPGPGAARDGQPKFDLLQPNPAYLARLRERVAQARDRGIFVSVMLFNGWSVGTKASGIGNALRRRGLGNPWPGHPFNRDNNINAIDGDPRRTGQGLTIHTLQVPEITSLQKEYVRRVVDSVNDLDNVLWEICNECDVGSEPWQYAMIEYIKQYEATKPKQHPVGMTAVYPGGNNEALFTSPADWVAPSDLPGQSYRDDPPVAQGKIVLTDTDHLWGIGGGPAWVWKSACRGLNPVFMDPMRAELIGDYYPMYRPQRPPPSDFERTMGSIASRIRDNMGYARTLMRRLDLEHAAPCNERVSSGYCIGSRGQAYVIFAPMDAYGLKSVWHGILRGHVAERVTVDLVNDESDFDAMWLRISTGEEYAGGRVRGGRRAELTAPFRGDAVLSLQRQAQNLAER